MKNLSIILSAVITLLFTQCTLDDKDVGPTYDIEVGQSVKHNISGVVVDENNQPVRDAQVDIMGTETVTDENGFFYLERVSVFEKHAYVKVHKQGYFLGSRSFYPTSGNNLVDIKLLKKNKVGSFDASNGGVVDFESVSIDMGAGFVTESGNEYTGKVNVSGKFIDPTADDIHDIMPGSLRAVSPDGESLLASFGMMAVELTDDAGNLLQLAKGNTAEISSPIPTDLASTAPEKLPLWYFNEDKGYWVEEGEATKVGNKYVGKVSHFSFWNCDIRVASREANGIIVHENGVPVANAVIIMKTDVAGVRQGLSCSEGKFRGLMPINVDINITVKGGTEGLRPYTITRRISSTENMGEIVIPDSYFPEPVNVSGSIVDCNNNPTGDIRLVVNGRYVVETNASGVFQTRLISNNSYRIYMMNKIDYRRQKEFVLSVADKDVTIPVMQFCPDGVAKKTLDVTYSENIKSYKCTYSIDGTEHSITGEFKVGMNIDKGQMSVLIGDGSRGAITGKFFEITMLSGLKMDGQPHFYTFNEDRTDKWIIDIATDLTPNEPIIPDGIRVDFFKWDLSPGGYSKVVFFGEFKEYDASGQKYINRAIENGVLEFTMNN